MADGSRGAYDGGELEWARNRIGSSVMVEVKRQRDTGMNFGADALEWLARTTGVAARHLGIVRMQGATSSSVFLIQCVSGTTSRRYVLRVLDNEEWLAEEPDLAAHEAAALEEARRAGLRAPNPVAYSSVDAGFGAPVVLMSFLEGRIVLRPADFQAWLDGLAGQLASIHRHTADTFQWRYRSWVDESALTPPAWTTIPRVWERAIERVLGTAPDARPVFIHRDYHPANVLWHNGAVSGVVDWINACRGPAQVDVAHCRINLAQMFGPAAATQFLDAYTRLADEFEHSPYWDVEAILDMCTPEPEFYPPWRDFGLGTIHPQALRQRVDTYLERVMLRN